MKPEPRKTTPARNAGARAANNKAAGRKATGKKKGGKVASKPGMFSRAAHAVGDVLVGAAAGAMAGAVTGAVEAGGKAMGIPPAGTEKEKPPEVPAGEPRGPKRTKARK